MVADDEWGQRARAAEAREAACEHKFGDWHPTAPSAGGYPRESRCCSKCGKWQYRAKPTDGCPLCGRP